MPAAPVEAIDHLRKHFADSVTPAQLARRAGLSPARFTRVVKRLLQLTRRQLILQTRLQVHLEQLIAMKEKAGRTKDLEDIVRLRRLHLR